MSSGSIYKALDVTIKKFHFNFKPTFEKCKFFQLLESNSLFEEKVFEIINLNTLEPSKDDFFNIVRKIHSFLSKTKELTSQQKLDYCRLERYFMKLYLKEFARI